MPKKKIHREIPIPGRRRLDIKFGNIAREEERSGKGDRIRAAISRLKTQRNAKKELGVPQWDMQKAIEEVRKSGVNITVTNITRTKRIKP